MPFELPNKTKVRVLDVRTLAAKDRKPDEPPGAQLLLQATLPVDSLTMFDGFLPGMLYRRAGGSAQSALDGLEGSELTSIGEHVKRIPWAYEQTGIEIEVDRGLGGKRNLTLDDCRMHGVVLMPQQAGSVKTQWKIDAPALSDDIRGKLTGLKATEIEMLLLLPVVDESQQQIPGTAGTDPNKAPAVPPEDATTAFVKSAKGKVVTLDGKR